MVSRGAAHSGRDLAGALALGRGAGGGLRGVCAVSSLVWFSLHQHYPLAWFAHPVAGLSHHSWVLPLYHPRRVDRRFLLRAWAQRHCAHPAAILALDWALGAADAPLHAPGAAWAGLCVGLLRAGDCGRRRAYYRVGGHARAVVDSRTAHHDGIAGVPTPPQPHLADGAGDDWLGAGADVCGGVHRAQRRHWAHEHRFQVLHAGVGALWRGVGGGGGACVAHVAAVAQRLGVVLALGVCPALYGNAALSRAGYPREN